MSRSALSWLGRACAVAALGCFALTLVAVHRGRVVQDSSRRIVADISTTNTIVGGANLTSSDATRVQVEALAAALVRLGDATTADVDLLGKIAAQVRSLQAAGGTDLGISRTLATTADAMARTTAGLRDAAVGGEAGAGQTAALLRTMADTLRVINAELARLGTTLAVIPELGG